MSAAKRRDTERKKVWKVTKDAVNAYAKNPCAATEHGVEAAVAQVGRLPNPCAPSPVKRGRKSTIRGI